MVCMEGMGLPKCVMFGELVGGADCVGVGQEKDWIGCLVDDLKLSASTPTSGRLQRRTRRAQDGGAGGGTFHGKMDRFRESQGWATACSSSMPERNGKGQEENSPNQACSYLCWFARHSYNNSRLVTSGANMYPPGGCRVVFLWRYVCLRLFCF